MSMYYYILTIIKNFWHDLCVQQRLKHVPNGVLQIVHDATTRANHDIQVRSTIFYVIVACTFPTTIPLCTIVHLYKKETILLVP